ncbi:MAG: hypothetical protein QM656_02170 [Paracoccaceae bacterium]
MHTARLVALILAIAPTLAAAGDADMLARAAEDGVHLPQDLKQLRIIALIRDGGDLLFDAIPAAGGPSPDPATAQTFACATPEIAAVIAAGGRVEVTLLGQPFARIDRCPPAP